MRLGRRRRGPGQREVTRGVVPALILAGGVHGLSFGKGVHGRGRQPVLSPGWTGVVDREQVWQERIRSAVKVRLGVAAIVAKHVVLELLVQLVFQGRRTATRPGITLDTLWWWGDTVQVLDTGFNRHQDAFRTHQRSWTICKSRRKVGFFFLVYYASPSADCLLQNDQV